MTEGKIQFGRVFERVLMAVSVITGLGVVITLMWIGFAHDYSALWTAARASLTRPEILYDARAITDLQAWVGVSGLRPWIYPPSTLLYLLPLSVLPFTASLWVWGLLSLGLYAFAAYSSAPQSKGMSTVVATISFVTLVGVVHGHASPAVAACVVLGLWQLDKNAIRAGVLLGIAATIKPQMVILVPLALVAGKHYRALTASVITGSAVGLLSIAVFGLGPWIEWARALPGFLDIVRAMDLFDRGASPMSLIWRVGIDGPTATLLRVLFGGVGIAACWMTFRHSKSLPYRLVAVVGGGVFMLPYAMGYDMAALAPAAAYFMVVNKSRAFDWILALASCSLLFAAGVYTSVIVIAFTLLVFYRAATRHGTVDEPLIGDARNEL